MSAFFQESESESGNDASDGENKEGTKDAPSLSSTPKRSFPHKEFPTGSKDGKRYIFFLLLLQNQRKQEKLFSADCYFNITCVVLTICRSYSLYSELIDLTGDSPPDPSGSGTEDELPKVEFSLNAPRPDAK